MPAHAREVEELALETESFHLNAAVPLNRRTNATDYCSLRFLLQAGFHSYRFFAHSLRLQLESCLCWRRRPHSQRYLALTLARFSSERLRGFWTPHGSVFTRPNVCVMGHVLITAPHASSLFPRQSVRMAKQIASCKLCSPIDISSEGEKINVQRNERQGSGGMERRRL
jgi:hypothetical protein